MIKIALFALMLVGCVETNEDLSNRACSVNDDDYITTEFDCGDEYVQRIICGTEEKHANRARCTSAWLVDEVHMGHCIAYNLCDR
tara:strand:+ start:910 stop:1164 length:255 start_codon:yes stop_codon:yes gene_type:complete